MKKIIFICLLLCIFGKTYSLVIPISGDAHNFTTAPFTFDEALWPDAIITVYNYDLRVINNNYYEYFTYIGTDHIVANYVVADFYVNTKYICGILYNVVIQVVRFMHGELSEIRISCYRA